MNQSSTGFVRNFRIVTQKDGQEKMFYQDSRWYAIADANTLQKQGHVVLDIQKWNKDAGDYVHDVSEPNEAKNLPARDSMEVLKERYAQKTLAAVDMETSDKVGGLAAIAKTLASQARKGGVEAQLTRQFTSEFFQVARLLGVSPQEIMEFSVANYPELAPRRRQEANA